MAKAPAKKAKMPALMIVVMKKGSGKKMRGKGASCGHDEDEGEGYKKGGMVGKKKAMKK
jgi:hypothetical protein